MKVHLSVQIAVVHGKQVAVKDGLITKTIEAGMEATEGIERTESASPKPTSPLLFHMSCSLPLSPQQPISVAVPKLSSGLFLPQPLHAYFHLPIL